jgi:hypothetical protein
LPTGLRRDYALERIGKKLRLQIQTLRTQACLSMNISEVEPDGLGFTAGWKKPVFQFYPASPSE